jgi:hypothetical protein
LCIWDELNLSSIHSLPYPISPSCL